MGLADGLLVTMAAHRLWFMWATDQEIFRALKAWIIRRGPRPMAYAAQCAVCSSVWCAAAMLAIAYAPYGRWLVLGLAISEGVVWLNSFSGILDRLAKA